VAKEISKRIPADFTDSLNVVYFPQLGTCFPLDDIALFEEYTCIGFLICIPLREEWRGDDGVQLLPDWSFQVLSYLHRKLPIKPHCTSSSLLSKCRPAVSLLSQS
jgi:DNA mismatch repair protein MSH5